MTRTDARLHLSLTDAGKTLLRGTGFVLLAAMIIPAFGVLAALVAVIAAALVIGLALRPRIEIAGDMPERVVAGTAVRVCYTLRNTARVPAYHLSVQFGALPEEIEQMAGGQVVASLAPGETAEVVVTIRPRRRGRYAIGQPTCQSDFPFGLFSFGVSRSDSQTLTVLPAFYRLPIMLGHRRRQVHSGGAGFAGRTELSPEYAGNRPFLPGDSPRTIDVRAWARLSVPATKEYHNDLDSYAALMLDTRVPARLRSSRPRVVRELEAAVSLCASLAFTIDRDCRTELLLAGPEMHQFSSWPATTRLDRIHDILAGVKASGQYHLEPMLPTLAERLEDVSEVMFVLSALDATYLPVLELATQAGCHSTVFVVGSPEATVADTLGAHWANDVVILSADEILAGPIEHL
jgi:uncharacterized protein (DUF58 family)